MRVGEGRDREDALAMRAKMLADYRSRSSAARDRRPEAHHRALPQPSAHQV